MEFISELTQRRAELKDELQVMFPPRVEEMRTPKGWSLTVNDEVTLEAETKGALKEMLKEAGLDYYNHNLDTSPEYYPSIISTRTYQDRQDTLAHVRNAGMKVCCGGIVGMGESRRDRAGLLMELADLPQHPESVPINMLVQVDGTPLSGTDPIEPLEFVRTIAVARIMMPASRVRLSAGRASMSDELQTLCFLAGANSIFCGETLLTTPNPSHDADMQLLERLGFNAADRWRVSAEAAG